MTQENLSASLVGVEFDPVTISWDQKDTILYALGVGAKPAQELNFLYERKGPWVLPSYAVIPGMRAMGNISKAVKLDIRRLLHGEQSVELLRPLPANATITLNSRISEVWDKGKAGVIGVTAEATDDDGPLFKTHSTLFYLGGGGFGGEPGPSTKSKNIPPDRVADFVIEHQTREEQGAIYRLSGDKVALHIDPEFAQKAGYDKPFMHGLCTYGFVCRAIISSLCNGDPAKFKSMAGRFAERVQFEEKIVTKIWITSPGEAVIQAENQDGVVVLSQAQASYQAQ